MSGGWRNLRVSVQIASKLFARLHSARVLTMGACVCVCVCVCACVCFCVCLCVCVCVCIIGADHGDRWGLGRSFKRRSRGHCARFPSAWGVDVSV